MNFSYATKKEENNKTFVNQEGKAFLYKLGASHMGFLPSLSSRKKKEGGFFARKKKVLKRGKKRRRKEK